MKHTTRNLVLLAWLGVVVLACNLTSPSEPPTIVPRATDTPLPTISYATLPPESLPQNVAAAPSNSQATQLNLMNQVDSDRLFFHVDTLTGFQTRHVNSPSDSATIGIGAAYNYVKGQFEAIQSQSQGNFNTFTQQFSLNFANVQTQQYNVVGVVSGTEVNSGYVVVAAHYDSITHDREDGLAYAPGANDDASGMAVLLETARIMSTRPHRRSVMFVAFSAEEVGRQGSIEFVKFLQSRNTPVSAMINLDIVGSQTGPNGEIDTQEIRVFSAPPNESLSRQLARAVEIIALTSPLNMSVLVQDLPDREGRYGDHLSFSEAGYPAVRLIEPLEERDRQHTARDSMEDIQASYLSRVAQLVLLSATSLADGPAAPRNISLRDNSQGTRTLVWEPSPDATSYIVALRPPGSLQYDQYFEWASNSVDWDGFNSTNFVGVVIFAKDANGILGPPSQEYSIP
ncbi:MAG: M20/M25/M40 family metallo-hydrolase [Anaerolineaceae bacterium]|nr:M20/M25/M40 family metallo-hydrolase [Anaerolineaceae bacterium]